MNDNYCNNCGKLGHLYHQCKMPITSNGLVVFRINEEKENQIEYLMIRRKDTLGFIDFMRGKYSIFNKDYIINMLKQMTNREKNMLKTDSFEQLWVTIWGNETISNQYKVEEIVSRERFHSLRDGVSLNTGDRYSLSSLIDESYNYDCWEEQEWGFPKGRRNYQEKDYECALREFGEETGFNVKQLKNLENILPFEELFTGSNYKSYKHKYFVSYMQYSISNHLDRFERSEVSKMEWKTYDECMNCIRCYNLEKKRLITNVNNSLNLYRIVFV